MKPRLFCQCLIVLQFFLLSSYVNSATIDLESSADTVTSTEQDVTVNVTLHINQKDDEKYYLRGVFFIPGTSDYCGYTWNGTGWYAGPVSSGEGWKNFLEVKISDSSWSGILRAKPDQSEKCCKNNGTYAFKLVRYTVSGSASSEESNLLSFGIAIPTSTPTPVPTEKPEEPTAVPSVRPSMTPTSIPTATPDPTAMPKNSVLPAAAEPTPKKSVVIDLQASGAGLPGTPDVLPASIVGASDSAGKKNRSLQPYIISLLLMGFGLALLSGVTVWQKIRAGNP